ncbi:unnamed protein product [Rhizophagus irregularis]|nr:unnamed protein product [Rhizophagus irregularis]
MATSELEEQETNLKQNYGNKITLKTKYYNSKDVKFSLSFHDNGDLKTIESKKSGSDLIKLFCKKRNFSPSTNVSVTYLFGFDVIILEKLRRQAVSKNKHPYDLISNSQQNRRLSALGKDIESTVTPLFHEYNFISSETNSPAKLLEVKIEINGQIILFVFDDSNKNSKLEITVRMCDEILLSRDGYREMAKIYPDLIRNYKIEECRLKISKEMEELVPINVFNMERELLSSTDDIDNSIINEIDNGVYRSINFLLHILVPILSAKYILKDNDPIYLKFGADGRNVGRYHNHVIYTICIFNQKDEVLLPENQYSMCLYIGKEKFECLDVACSYFISEIQNLQANGFTDKSDKNWSIELFFSGDWKIMQLLLGLKAPTSIFFCLYCECNKNQRSNMDIRWINGENKRDVKFSLSFHDNGDLKTIESKKSGSDLIKLFCKKRNFSPSTNVSVTYLFGFDVIILEKLRRQAVSKNKHPYDLISNSQQNRRLSALGKDIESTVTPLFHEYNFISSETNSPAKLLEVKIEINGQIILFVFDDSNKNSKLEITVRMCDEILLSRDGYREMAKIYPDLIRNYKIEECRLKISKEMEELVPINVFNMERELLSSTDDIDNSIINEIDNGIMILFI